MELIVQSAALKKALSIVSLATGDKVDTLPSHALFRLKDGKLKMFSTDGDRFAVASCDTMMAAESDANEFTADPKKLTALLNSSDGDSIRLLYKAAETTLHAFASEHQESYVAFGSFKPENALSFEGELDNLQKVKTINAEVLKRGIKFTQGFISTEENNRRYSCVYAANGTLYGSNGHNSVAAFQSIEFEGVEFLVLRGPMIPQMLSAIDRFDSEAITIMTTSKFVSFWSDTGDGFGYLKSNEELPKLPISLDRPDWDSYTVNRSLLVKKLNRLAIATNDKRGIKTIIKNDNMDLITLDERASTESIPVTRKTGTEALTIIPDFDRLLSALNLYWTDEVDVYFKTREVIFCDGVIEIQHKGEETPRRFEFKASCVIALAKAT